MHSTECYITLNKPYYYYFMETRLNMKYEVNKARSQKYKFSAIPQMQRMLNKDYDVRCKNFKQCMMKRN